jgi:hypothetical protein
LTSDFEPELSRERLAELVGLDEFDRSLGSIVMIEEL